RQMARGISGHTVMLLAGVVIGILVFVGLLSLHAAFLIPPPGAAPPSDYTNLIRTLGWTAVVSMDLAVSLTVMLAWVVGAARSDVPDASRRGIFIFATVFLAIWILVGSPLTIHGRLIPRGALCVRPSRPVQRANPGGRRAYLRRRAHRSVVRDAAPV